MAQTTKHSEDCEARKTFFKELTPGCPGCDAIQMRRNMDLADPGEKPDPGGGEAGKLPRKSRRKMPKGRRPRTDLSPTPAKDAPKEEPVVLGEEVVRVLETDYPREVQKVVGVEESPYYIYQGKRYERAIAVSVPPHGTMYDLYPSGQVPEGS